MPTINAQKIKGPLSAITALSAPSSKTPLPTYQSISISMSDGQIEFRCDGQSGFGKISFPMDGNSFERVFVDTRKFTGAINAVGETFDLKRTRNGILLKGASSEIELRAVSCDHQANITEDVTEWHRIDGKSIARAMRRTYGLFDAATAVTLGSEGAVYCAANSSRFVWETGLSIPFRVAIQVESVRMFAGFIEKDDVQIGETSGLCVAKYSSEESSGAIAVRKMEYGKLAPYSYEVTQSKKVRIASVLKQDLAKALSACAVVESADNTEVEIRVMNNQMTFKKRATDYGTSSAVVNLQNFVDGFEVIERHDGQRLLKVLSDCFRDEQSIDVCTIQAGNVAPLAFCSGNAVGLSAPLE